METIAIIPAHSPSAVRWALWLNAAGHKVVACGCDLESLPQDVYTETKLIPHITDPHFADTCISFFEEAGIRLVISPHHIVRHALLALNKKMSLGIEVLNPSDNDRISAEQQFYAQFAKGIADASDQLGIHASVLPGHTRVATILRHFSEIEGECDLYKALCLIAVMADCPHGDIVEIGSLWGRSAFVFGAMAKFRKVGKVLCIDPWERAAAYQESSDDTVKQLHAVFPFEEAEGRFICNLSPYFEGELNYLRATSQTAYHLYNAELVISNDNFGTVPYTGRISVAHIDGNHDFAHVEKDLASWGAKVVPGGWIIMDDYGWGLGSGPAKATDNWIAAHKDAVARQMLIGETMYIKMAL